MEINSRNGRGRDKAKNGNGKLNEVDHVLKICSLNQALVAY